MKEIVFSLIGIIVSAIAGAFVNEWWHLIRARRPYAKVLCLKPKDKTVIVIPHRSRGIGNAPSGSNAHVTYEDMLAANYAERTLTLAGIPDDNIELCSVRQFKRERARLEGHNLVLICSPKANEITNEVLGILNLNKATTGFSVEFKKSQVVPEQWSIFFQNAELKSQSYEQVDDMMKKSADPEEGVQSDYGIIVRVPNPWNIKKKLIILAGIRGIGTWGAARYLLEFPQDILKRCGSKDFVCIVDIKYDNFKMAATYGTAFFSKLNTD